MSALRRMEDAFESAQARGLGREQRAHVTALLEQALCAIIAETGPDMFVEVGAFAAEFSRLMKARHPAAPVLALEANPRVFARYQAEVSAAGVQYLHLAAAARSGEVTLNIPEVVGGRVMPAVSRMSSLQELEITDSRAVQVTVPAITLDECCDPVPAGRLCLWIDVEGALDKVLAGAPRTLARAALVYCEVEQRRIWKDQLLVAGVLEQLERAGLVLVARDFQTPLQFNALFLRADLAASEPVRARVGAYATAAVAAVRALVAGEAPAPLPLVHGL